MSPARVWRLLRKDLALGPRSPIFMWAIVLPVALTVVFQFAFGSLFEPKPRLAIVDEGRSQLTQQFVALEGIEVTVLDDAAAMGDAVRLNDYDAGLVLPADFDREIRAGEKPLLELFVSGESLASNRLIIAVTTLDFVRDVEGTVPPVQVEVVDIGREALPLSLRLVPIIMMYALLVAGVFVPGSSLVDEKEKGTLSAVLVTPVRASEVLLSKALLGTLLAFVMAAVTLAMNRALGSRPFELVLVLFVAAGVSATLGLVAGEFAKDSTVLFSIIKGTGWFLMAPVIFYLFPDWPQWIAKLFPMYWVIDPIWQIAVLNRSLADVWWEVLIAVGIMVALIPVVGLLSKRMVVRLASD